MAWEVALASHPRTSIPSLVHLDERSESGRVVRFDSRNGSSRKRSL